MSDAAPQLTNQERDRNAFRALSKLVPGAGAAIEQLWYGPIESLRNKRIETTLDEILDRLVQNGQEPTKTEEFVNLLERAGPKIARATNDDVRDRFRDLLTRAAILPPSDEQWAQANLAEQLLSELDAPALAIVAAIARYDGVRPRALVSLPKPQIVHEKQFDWDNPALGVHQIGYDWAVIEEWLRRLREKRIVLYASVHGAKGFGGVSLNQLGKMLVDWTVAPPPAQEKAPR